MSASINHVIKQIASIDSSGAFSPRGVAYEGDPATIARTSFAREAPSWSAMLFVDNIGNERGLLRDSFSPRYNTVMRPRTYGVQFSSIVLTEFTGWQDATGRLAASGSQAHLRPGVQ